MEYIFDILGQIKFILFIFSILYTLRNGLLFVLTILVKEFKKDFSKEELILCGLAISFICNYIFNSLN